MGCFPACFSHWRHKESMKNVQGQCLSPSHEAVKLLQATAESLKEEEIVSPMKLVSEGKCEEQMNKSNGEDAVFANSSVKKCTNELTSSNGEKSVEVEEVEEEMDRGKDDGLESKSLRRLPCSENHGHQDFLIDDKDFVSVNSKEITLECCPVQEESSESLFSLSIDSRKHVFAAEMGEREVSSPLKPNERENSTKRLDHFLVKTSLKCDEDKENVPLSKNPISFDESKPTSDLHQFKKRDCGIGVDTSLSSWLVESEFSPQKTSADNSPESEKNYGDRRIRAELKELNASSSAGSTPCCSADDHLEIGTVGRYWRRRGLAGEVVDMGSVSCCRGVSPVWTKV